MCAWFIFFIFCDFRFYTSNKQTAISKKKKKMFDSTQNWNGFWKIIVQDKYQVSKNFKQLFLRYNENATGSVRNFAKCTW